MRHLRQAFSAPSKQMPGLNPRGDLNSIASISASSTISTPSSELSASKPRDSALKREQNPRYEHDNGLRHALPHQPPALVSAAARVANTIAANKSAGASVDIVNFRLLAP